ncbi:winged helix-turn-helix domain-containing protein [Amycolatopsis sp. A133]|uniref:ArsR/SmtB family transcription factor n=1 Tax=Amycolatopsis sp. A133 TaxID=3064472 RepID=UPI0027F728AA|nr:winged helix-turn-helix domain-containing protein [Amycolatopsis sp. A133]MDQ7807605.1 winged helix-turn-helix domain-containing protein [Amycolatopsis sp. A133]
MGEHRKTLHIHFETDDLARTRVQHSPDPLWETLLSLHLLQGGTGQPVFGEWRSWVRQRLDRSAGLLLTLAPPRGYSVDFLTPGAGATDLETALEDVLSTPRPLLAADLTELAAARPLPSWASSLAAGEPAALHELGAAVRRYFSVAVQPYWPAIVGQARADRLQRGEIVLDGGIEAMLSTLHPQVRWQSPVLEVEYPVDQHLHLGGRGLLLVPSLFCWQSPVTLLDAGRQPVLVYPIDRRPGWFTGIAPVRGATALLGRTRAAVLEAICARPLVSTTEVAVELGISPAGASQHATVLRDSGLIVTDRVGGAARHRPTTFGSALLTVSAS